MAVTPKYGGSTEYYNLDMPRLEDDADIGVINADMELIDTALHGKVDVVSGKGLSTNDYTTTEKNKLSNIETEANKTTITNNLTTSSTGTALDASQGKVLKDTTDDILTRYGKIATYAGSDLNTIIDAGMYQLSGSFTSTPAPPHTNASHLLVMCGGASGNQTRILQVLTRSTSNTNTKGIYYRRCVDDPTVTSNWSEWYRIWDDTSTSTTFNVTPSSLVGSSPEITATKSGNTVCISGMFTVPTAQTTHGYMTLFTVPEGYRPSGYIYAPLSSATSTGLAFVPPMIRLGSNGAMQSYLREAHAYGSSINWYFNMTYQI